MVCIDLLSATSRFDDLLTSHASSDAVTDVINQLSKEFGKESPLSVHRGKKHDYLGMEMDWSTEGEVKLTMNDCLEDIMATLPKELQGGCLL